MTGSTVLSKERIFLPVGAHISREMKISQGFKLMPHAGNINNRYDKNTKTFLLIARSTSASSDGQGIVCKWTKHFRYTAEGLTDDKIGYRIQLDNAAD